MIKIEVTGNSLAEVSDKLLAIGASLQRAVPADNAFREALEEHRDLAKAEDKPTVGTEAAKRTRKAKPAEGNAASTAEVASPTSSSEPDTATAEAAPSPSEPEAPKQLDFDKEVAPLVLKLVAAKGPEAIKKILDQFGVQRASQIDPARFGELVGLITDVL